MIVQRLEAWIEIDGRSVHIPIPGAAITEAVEANPVVKGLWRAYSQKLETTVRDALAKRDDLGLTDGSGDPLEAGNQKDQSSEAQEHTGESGWPDQDKWRKEGAHDA